jgi:hypothetical protein
MSPPPFSHRQPNVCRKVCGPTRSSFHSCWSSRDQATPSRYPALHGWTGTTGVSQDFSKALWVLPPQATIGLQLLLDDMNKRYRNWHDSRLAALPSNLHQAIVKAKITIRQCPASVPGLIVRHSSRRIPVPSANNRKRWNRGDNRDRSSACSDSDQRRSRTAYGFSFYSAPGVTID